MKSINYIFLLAVQFNGRYLLLIHNNLLLNRLIEVKKNFHPQCEFKHLIFKFLIVIQGYENCRFSVPSDF